MSLLDTEYNSGSSTGGNNSSGYEERPRISLNNYAIISFTIGELSEYTGNYGQNVYVDLDDVELIHGMYYDRTWSGPAGSEDYTDKMMKLFGFGSWFKTDENGKLSEEIEEKYINHRITENFGKNEFPYEYVDMVREGQDTIDVGNMDMKLSNSTKNRTFLKVITEAGHDVIDDKEDEHSWVNEENVVLRDDLEDRRLILFFKHKSFTPDGDDKEVTYTDAVVLDANTGAGVTIQNGNSSSSTSSSSSGTSSDSKDGDSGTLGGNDDDSLPEGVPEDADEIIDFMARTGETDPDGVENLVSGEADEYDLDAVVAEVKRRME